MWVGALTLGAAVPSLAQDKEKIVIVTIYRPDGLTPYAYWHIGFDQEAKSSRG